MMDEPSGPEPGSRIHLPSWAWFFACFGAALEALDGRLLYGEHLAPMGLALALFGRAVLGAIVGGIVGLVIGAIALGVEPFVPRRGRKRGQPVRAAWLIGLALGIAVGAYNVATSPSKAAHDKVETACGRILADLNSGQLELDARHSLKGAAFASDALSQLPACKKPEAVADEAQAHLLIAIAGYQTNLPYMTEAQTAQQLASACLRRFTKPDDLIGARCQSVAQGAQATATQQYCDSSMRLTNDADDSIAHLAYDLGHEEATQALGMASKCKNPYAYAYRGMALLKRGLADYLDGQKTRGSADIAAGKQLLDRCIAEVDVDSPQVDLRKNCAIQLSAAKPMLPNGRT